MKWSRAKTIFIYIFMFVNLFLFVVYQLNTFEGKQINTANVVGILENYNINATTDVFKKFPNKMKQIEATNISGNKELLKNLVGENYELKDGIATNDTRSFNITSGIYTDSAPNDKTFRNINISNAGGKVKIFLHELGLKKNSYRVYNFKDGKDGSFTGIAGYEFEGLPVFGCGLKITAEKKGVTRIEGRFFNFSRVENRYYNVCPAESILLDYLSLFGNIYGKEVAITGIQSGYYVPDEVNSASSYAIPAYEFSFSNNKKLILDARENIESAYKLLSK